MKISNARDIFQLSDHNLLIVVLQLIGYCKTSTDPNDNYDYKRKTDNYRQV